MLKGAISIRVKMKLLSVAIVCLMILVASPIYSVNALGECDYTIRSGLDTIISEALVPDDLLEAPSYVVRGATGEFTHTFEPGAATLSWNHNPNVTIPSNYEPSEFYFTSEDYEYLYLNFTWSTDPYPYSANISINYSVTLSGDFNAASRDGPFAAFYFNKTQPA